MIRILNIPFGEVRGSFMVERERERERDWVKYKVTSQSSDSEK